MSLSDDAEILSTKTLAIKARDAEVSAAEAFKTKVIEDVEPRLGLLKLGLLLH